MTEDQDRSFAHLHQLEAARAAALEDYINASVSGWRSGERDLTDWPAAYRDEYTRERERLEAEHAATLAGL